MNQDLLSEYTEVVAKNPYVSQFGIEILNIRPGYVFARMRAKKELENIYGDLHGGCLYAFADNMAGVAASTYGYYVTTLNGSIQYLKAGRNTEYIYCEVNVIKHGRTITVAQARITDDRKTLINTAEFTYFNLKEKTGERSWKTANGQQEG